MNRITLTESVDARNARIEAAKRAIKVVPFSTVAAERTRYYIQTQAPAGGWVEHMGCSELDTVVQHAAWMVTSDGHSADKVRIVDMHA